MVRGKIKALQAARWSLICRANRLDRLNEERQALLRGILADVRDADALLAELHAIGEDPPPLEQYIAARKRLLRILKGK